MLRWFVLRNRPTGLVWKIVFLFILQISAVTPPPRVVHEWNVCCIDQRDRVVVYVVGENKGGRGFFELAYIFDTIGSRSFGQLIFWFITEVNPHATLIFTAGISFCFNSAEFHALRLDHRWN